MFKSTITSKGQLTVPKEIRDSLGLRTGDEVVFKITDSNIVTFEKSNTFIKCPVCHGYGAFNINDLPCFFCNESKHINNTDSIWQLISVIMATSSKYGVTVTVESPDTPTQAPKLKLESKRYFEQILDKAHDYLQMRLREECMHHYIRASKN